MNDFTKEELQYIFYCTDIVTHGNDEHDIHEQLLNKMSAMIENYCEHEYKKTLAESGMYFISMCHKCLDSKPWTVFDEPIKPECEHNWQQGKHLFTDIFCTKCYEVKE